MPENPRYIERPAIKTACQGLTQMKSSGNCDLAALYDNTSRFRRFAIYKNGKVIRVSHNIPAWYQKWMSAGFTSVWKETQEAFNGEAERVGLRDEQDVVDMIKEMKEETW